MHRERRLVRARWWLVVGQATEGSPSRAHVLRTSRKAIYTMVERRQLPGIVRLGRRVLVRQDALLDWLRQKSTPSLER